MSAAEASAQPLVDVRGDEIVVLQRGIGATDAVDVCHLAWREILVRIQTPPSLEEPLPPKDFVETGDAAGEVIARVE